MFQVPIIVMQLSNWQEKKQSLLKLYKKYTANDYFETHKENEIETNFHYLSNNREERMKFCKEISLILQEEFYFLGEKVNNNLHLDMAWFQLYKKNQQHTVHNHGALNYSFVCFVEFNPEFHKPTTFISPFNNFENGSVVYHTPNVDEGGIIFFPSAILHESAKNISEKERIILSGNFLFSR